MTLYNRYYCLILQRLFLLHGQGTTLTLYYIIMVHVSNSHGLVYMYGNRWMCTRNMIFGQFCVNFDTKRTLVTLMLDGSYAHVRAQNQNSKETPNFASSLIISYLRYHSSCHQSLRNDITKN